MKRLSLMIHIIVVCIVAGILHAGHMYRERAENILSIRGSVSQYSENMPWVVFDPITGTSP